MKKTLIHIFQYKFTNHDYYNREYAELEKKFKIKVIVQDLSKIFYPNLNYIKAKNFKNSIRFKSLNEWVESLKKYEKKKNVFIVNELGFDTFKSLIIHYYLKKSNLKILMDMNSGVVDPADYSKDLNFKIVYIKIKKVLVNPYSLFYFLKKRFLSTLFFLLKFDKISILTAGDRHTNLPFRSESKKIVEVHSRDYSNYLNYKKKIKKKRISQ